MQNFLISDPGGETFACFVGSITSKLLNLCTAELSSEAIISQTAELQAEAPAVFQPSKEEFIIIASHLTGWSANSPQQFRSRGSSLCAGELEVLDPPAVGPGAETTFNSQVGYAPETSLDVYSEPTSVIERWWKINWVFKLPVLRHVWFYSLHFGHAVDRSIFWDYYSLLRTRAFKGEILS